MAMTAMDFAKIFMQKGLGADENSFDGNRKLQKLLFFADFISLAEYGEPLFSDPIQAFQHGCVVESVRQRHAHGFSGLLRESLTYEPKLDPQQQEVVDLTVGIFGDCSSRELSELNHSFRFWKDSYGRSFHAGNVDRPNDIVTDAAMLAEADRIREAVRAYRDCQGLELRQEQINGIRFHYPPDLELAEDVISVLERFSLTAKEQDYTVYRQNGRLVIY